MKNTELRSLIREQVKSLLKEASYKPSDDEFIEKWMRMELGAEVGDAIIDQTIEDVKEEWKEAAVNYPNVRSYLMDLRKNGGLEGLGESINEATDQFKAVDIPKNAINKIKYMVNKWTINQDIRDALGFDNVYQSEVSVDKNNIIISITQKPRKGR
jgi:acyl-homoserine lactone acylase PvdQ